MCQFILQYRSLPLSSRPVTEYPDRSLKSLLMNEAAASPTEKATRTSIVRMSSGTKRLPMDTPQLGMAINGWFPVKKVAITVGEGEIEPEDA